MTVSMNDAVPGQSSLENDMKICIYGAGAIGGYLGVQLALRERMSA